MAPYRFARRLAAFLFAALLCVLPDIGLLAAVLDGHAFPAEQNEESRELDEKVEVAAVRVACRPAFPRRRFRSVGPASIGSRALLRDSVASRPPPRRLSVRMQV